jgi:C-terminal processing protease CtpA/Prc
MDPTNYLAVELEKPMGIVFEENDEEYGGIFVQSLKEDGIAAKNGVIVSSDQLVSVGLEKVSGMSFDNALGKIVESEATKTKLVMFRGSAKQLYGPTGASQEWLDEFIAGGAVEVSS